MFDKIKRFFKNGYSDNAGMKDSESESTSFEEEMKHLENYFKRNSETDERFLPEYEVSKKINTIALKEEVSEHELHEIVQIFNEANLKPHYNGSGWFDLRIHIQSLLIKKNMRFETLSNKNPPRQVLAAQRPSWCSAPLGVLLPLQQTPKRRSWCFFHQEQTYPE
jgi:hypothetical protein